MKKCFCVQKFYIINPLEITVKFNIVGIVVLMSSRNADLQVDQRVSSLWKTSLEATYWVFQPIYGGSTSSHQVAGSDFQIQKQKLFKINHLNFEKWQDLVWKRKGTSPMTPLIPVYGEYMVIWATFMMPDHISIILKPLFGLRMIPDPNLSQGSREHWEVLSTASVFSYNK